MAEQDHNVGILAMEVYFPGTYVTQVDMEISTKVSAGKYTIGLGQDEMAFTGDREDINSIALTVVKSLMEKYNIDPKDVGRLEIGTESIIDKSKSTKTVLLELFAESGNTDIEGVTVLNACYGGTAAMLNALSWVDSSAWDGRYAIVVAADIAVYADGPARPTGGCGSVALLVGRNAPVKIDLRTRTTHASHTWDFFKPNLESEYPVVNGALSQTCYLRALDDCYGRFVKKNKDIRGRDASVPNTDYMVFHSPYNKLVQKSFGRLLFQDMVIGVTDSTPVAKWLTMPVEKTYEDKDLETTLKAASSAGYKSKVDLSCRTSKLIGNTYTASVWINLCSLVSSLGKDLVGKNVTLFSYGSGAVASMLAIIPRETGHEKFNLESIQSKLNIAERLAQREKLTPKDLDLALKAREESHGAVPFNPKFNIDKLIPGTYYLEEITKGYVRVYKRKPLDSVQKRGGSQFENAEDDGDVGVDLDEPSDIPVMKPPSGSPRLVHAGIPRNQTYVWATGKPNVKVVVTGIAAALPGRDNEVFPPGVNNVRRIINGESFLSKIPDEVKDAMLEKNPTLMVKNADGSTSKVAVTTYEQCINVSASLGKFSLTSYGVSESIVSTMDRAVQVSIAAGLEALKDAHLVSGQGPNGWELPPSMQNTTGIVYATSFPALDTAIEEVSKYFNTKSVDSMQISGIISGLRKRLESATGTLSTDSEEALGKLEALVHESCKDNGVAPYEFDRKFLFRVLVLGNAQLAQIIKAKGPNMQTNAACAGATQALALAYDMIQVGRAERVVLIAGDSAASDTLLPWLGNGFRTLGAATTCADLKLASRPFHPERSGMILGSGGIGLILESEEGAIRRYQLAVSSGQVSTPRKPFKCRLLGTLVSNSAYHGAAMDRNHIAEEMERFISSMEKDLTISRKDIAKHGVYFSHETSTHASPSSSCAANEVSLVNSGITITIINSFYLDVQVFALRKVFGEDLKNLLILNTKGFTGHPMGVSFEDVVAAEVLTSGMVPPIANFSEVDPALGSDLKFSKGGAYPCKYAIRFAAGFGSQIALALYGSSDL